MTDFSSDLKVHLNPPLGKAHIRTHVQQVTTKRGCKLKKKKKKNYLTEITGCRTYWPSSHVRTGSFTSTNHLHTITVCFVNLLTLWCNLFRGFFPAPRLTFKGSLCFFPEFWILALPFPASEAACPGRGRELTPGACGRTGTRHRCFPLRSPVGSQTSFHLLVEVLCCGVFVWRQVPVGGDVWK